MELVYFLTVVGLLALIGIVWNLVDMHNESKHAEAAQ